MIKTKTANQIKAGDMVRVKGYEMWVDSVRINNDGQITFWGSWVLTVASNQEITVVQENWGD
jgi:hypothetical protein